ncbi:MAG: SDR family NAD(P)-dependent oxidoreductase [Proteobacteria bacterium]|nr:SDR family NAD(P)-dependent oxidoreductase [Pseudomonadota bacterium]MDA1058293.1 SDR family NAD(P)-dependent oxidoreductase [Pseudomonadota bacterium]
MAERHAGKTALVTGGANGIGRGIVERLHRDGANVVVADIDMTAGRALETALGSRVVALETDVRDEAAITASVEQAVTRFGRVDIMVNNAGYIMFSPVVETSADDWRRMMDVNINGIFLGMKAGAKQMIAQGTGGSIVNASSGGGRKGVPNFAHYCATKAAIIMMSQAAAGELAGNRIRVNCYTPGHVETPMMNGLLDTIAGTQGTTREQVYQALEDEVPWGRWGKVEDVAATVSWLCSDDAEYITGQCIAMNGGQLPW